MVVPAPGVILLQQQWALPRVQQEVHLMLLPPGKRLAQELSGFVQVEVSGPEEAQHMLILWNLCTADGQRFKETQRKPSNRRSKKRCFINNINVFVCM